MARGRPSASHDTASGSAAHGKHDINSTTKLSTAEMAVAEAVAAPQAPGSQPAGLCSTATADPSTGSGMAAQLPHQPKPTATGRKRMAAQQQHLTMRAFAGDSATTRQRAKQAATSEPQRGHVVQ